MFNIAFNGIITVTRGDSFSFPLRINFGTSLEPAGYGMSKNDKVYLAIMEPNQSFESALIKKVYTYEDIDSDGNILVKFKPKDTQCVLPGKYYYQIKLQRFHSDDLDDYDVDTVIDKTLFYIME